MAYNVKIIGSQIQKYRKEKRLSQKELGKLVGLSGSYIGNLESGGHSENSSVSMMNICKIANVLNVSLDDLASSNIELKRYSNNYVLDEIGREINSLDLENLKIMHNLLSNFKDVYK